MKNQTARHIGITIVSVAFVLLMCFSAWRIFRPHERHVELDRSHYPIKGLDLSAHNGTPDFDSIAAAGIDFVYLKASEGESFRDTGFLRNYSQARKNGIAVGAYHFSGSTATDAARHSICCRLSTAAISTFRSQST